MPRFTVTIEYTIKKRVDTPNSIAKTPKTLDVMFISNCVYTLNIQALSFNKASADATAILEKAFKDTKLNIKIDIVSVTK